MFVVYYWDKHAEAWQVAQGGFSTYAAACRWASAFETPSLRAVVRRHG